VRYSRVQLDFKLRAEPLQLRHKHKADPDIPPNEPSFNDTKKFHTCDPDRGKHEANKLALKKCRAEKDKKQGKKGDKQGERDKHKGKKYQEHGGNDKMVRRTRGKARKR
jgi:hypothetical protein